MPWDFSTEPEFEQKLAWMRTFVREEIWPLEVLDEAGRETLWGIIRGLQEEVKRQGLWAAHLPPDLGGQGFGQVKLALMHEIIGTTRIAPFVFGNQAPDSGNAEIIALVGTDEQKKKWLYPLLDQQLLSAFSMTEPTAGADPTMLKTTAVLDGDEWVINGHKWFSSNAVVCDFLIVMVVTDPAAEPHRRASMIIVPKATPGVNVLRNIPTMDAEEKRFGFGHSEVLYENVRVPQGNLLGKPGDGFTIAQLRLGPGRIHHCMRWIGQAQRAFDMMCERALQRQIGGATLSRKQTVQNWIADSAAEMQAARLMTMHAAWRMDREGAKAARTDIGMIKYFGAKVLYDVIDRAIQIHGSLGYSGDLPLEEMYRRARAGRIYDGPDEVHRVAVARQILRRYTAPEGIWPRDHIPTRRAAARAKFAHLLDVATANQ